MYQPSHSEPQQWKFVPVPGHSSTYQIISISTQQALTMSKVEGQKEYQIRLQQPSQQDQQQQWKIEDVETGEQLTYNQRSQWQQQWQQQQQQWQTDY